MTMTNKQAPAMNRKLSLAETLALFTEAGKLPLKFTAYDGSSAGPDDAALGVDRGFLHGPHLGGSDGGCGPGSWTARTSVQAKPQRHR
jgi:hypothetical protein